jgi:hypothetical protein
MVSFKWFDRVPSISDPVPREPDLDTELDDTGEFVDDFADDSVELADIFLYIEYRNAGGISTQRAITIKKQENDSSHPSILAWCHTRKALRQFRLDRISSIVTVDGEVFQPAKLFWESIGHRVGAEIEFSQAKANDRTAASGVKRQFNNEIVVLAALSGSDGNMHERELDEIIDYLERELEWERMAVQTDEISAIRNHIKRMRITRERLETSVKLLLTGEGKHRLYARQLQRFLTTAKKVVDADGRIHEAEFLFLDFLEKHLE